MACACVRAHFVPLPRKLPAGRCRPRPRPSQPPLPRVDDPLSPPRLSHLPATTHSSSPASRARVRADRARAQRAFVCPRRRPLHLGPRRPPRGREGRPARRASRAPARRAAAACAYPTSIATMCRPTTRRSTSTYSCARRTTATTTTRARHAEEDDDGLWLAAAQYLLQVEELQEESYCQRYLAFDEVSGRRSNPRFQYRRNLGFIISFALPASPRL